MFALALSGFAFVLAQSQYLVDAAVAAGCCWRVGTGGRLGGAPNFWLTSCAVCCHGLPLTPDAPGYLEFRWR